MNFIQLRCGSDGKDRVLINVDEIASFQSHTVVSYTYEEWVLVTLKSGKEHDCKVTLKEFQTTLREAVAG